MDKDKFFNVNRLNTGTVDIDGFGEVEVHELTLLQRMTLSDIVNDEPDTGRARVVVMGCDAFTSDDIPKLVSMKSEPLLKLFSKIVELSGLDDTEKKA